MATAAKTQNESTKFAASLQDRPGANLRCSVDHAYPPMTTSAGLQNGLRVLLQSVQCAKLHHVPAKPRITSHQHDSQPTTQGNQLHNK